jgi:hypothetical protein
MELVSIESAEENAAIVTALGKFVIGHYVTCKNNNDFLKRIKFLDFLVEVLTSVLFKVEHVLTMGMLSCNFFQQCYAH